MNDIFTDVPICITFPDFIALPEPLFSNLSEYYLVAECGMIFADWPDECGEVMQ